MNLGSRLKHILNERGLTVTRFAKDADIPAQTVYALINRDSNKADMDILMKVLAALDMDFFTFMGAEAPSTTGAAAPSNAETVAAPAAVTPERIVEKVVEKVVVKEVPAAAPEGKAAIYINADTYEKLVALAAEEDITDDAILADAIESYMEQGFDYRQRPLRSIFRDSKPRSRHSGDMDSFLL